MILLLLGMDNNRNWEMVRIKIPGHEGNKSSVQVTFLILCCHNRSPWYISQEIYNQHYHIYLNRHCPQISAIFWDKKVKTISTGHSSSECKKESYQITLTKQKYFECI